MYDNISTGVLFWLIWIVTDSKPNRQHNIFFIWVDEKKKKSSIFTLDIREYPPHPNLLGAMGIFCLEDGCLLSKLKLFWDFKKRWQGFRNLYHFPQALFSIKSTVAGHQVRTKLYSHELTWAQNVNHCITIVTHFACLQTSYIL